MNCLNPYRMRNPRYPDESPIEFIDCACGKCYPCLVNRRQSWLFRLSFESEYSIDVGFLTLTYDDTTCDGDLHRKHFTNFIKKMRRYADFKYYAIGEFGTTTLRPHYHAILFFKGYHYIPLNKPSDPFNDMQYFIERSWSYGFNSFCRANSATLNYVLHYHVRPKEPIKGKHTFFACSKRLGLQFLFDANGNPNDQLVNLVAKSRCRIVSDALGHKFVIPRYYVKKLEEAGYDVLPPVPHGKYKTFVNAIYNILPDLKVSADGHPLNYSESFVVQLLHDLQSDSERKLSKYNYQTKTSI